MDKAKLGTRLAVSGMAALLTGQRMMALGLFGRGLKALEDHWREAHPDFAGGMDARWQRAVDFYNSTHKEPTNRKLHMVGIPMILGGAVGLLTMPRFRPVWMASAGAFAAGWALNIVGHKKFEGNAPAFMDDPLSFVAGPVWDVQQWMGKGKNGDVAQPDTTATAQPADAPPVVLDPPVMAQA